MDFSSWMSVILLFISMGHGFQETKSVDRCPRNKHEWDIHAKHLNCTSLPINATYHCVLNENGTGLIEVCARPTPINGHRCTEFNTRGHCLQHSAISCEDGIYSCPYRYMSTEAYKYQSCYEAMTICKVTDQRTDSIDADSKTKVKNKQNNSEQNHERNREQTYEHEPKTVNNHCYCNTFDINALGVTVSITVCILIAGFAIYRYLKKKKSSQRDPSQIPLQNVGRDNVEADL